MPTLKALQKRRKTVRRQEQPTQKIVNVENKPGVKNTKKNLSTALEGIESHRDYNSIFNKEVIDFVILKELLKKPRDNHIPNSDRDCCPLFLCARNNNIDAVELIIEACGETTCAYNVLLGSMYADSADSFDKFLTRFLNKLPNEALLDLITEAMSINQEKMKIIFDYMTIRKRADLGFLVKEDVSKQIQKMVDSTKYWYQKWFTAVSPYDHCISACQENDLAALIKFEALNSNTNGCAITHHNNLLMKIAICHENTTMMKFLSECGCEVDSLDFAVEMAAHRAVKWIVAQSHNLKADSKYKFSLNHSKHIELAKKTNPDLYQALVSSN
jgi:hypothetical protein